MTELRLPPYYFHVTALILGALVGSFLNVVIARLPDPNASIVRPRSKCPHCGYMIPSWLNLPILSWLVLRGKCASCKAPISVRYPVVELLTSLLFLAVYMRYGLSLATLGGLILTASLIAITFIDIDIWEIPDEISLPGIVIGAALRPFAYDVPWYDGLIGAALGAGFLWFIRWIFFVLRDMEGMGLGDVKLIAMIGAFVGPFGLIPTILISSVSGSIIGAIVLTVAKVRGTDQQPIDDATEVAADEAPEPTAPDEDADGEGDEDDWVPPANAVPFGPFLSMGAIATLLFARDLESLLFGFAR